MSTINDEAGSVRSGMTWKAGPAACRRRLVATFVSVVLLAAATLSLAKPPSPPPPAAPGTIFFTYAGDVWQMNGTGGNKLPTGLLPPEPVRPSANFYNGRRWWLINHSTKPDVYATNGVGLIKITNGYDRNDGVTRRLWRVKLRGVLAWSNDGLDSFISFPAVEAEYDAVTGTRLWARHVLYRIDLGAQDLEDLYQAGGPDPLLEDSSPLLTECVASTMLYEDQFDQHDWSPDGTKVAYNFLDQSLSNGRADLYVADVSNVKATGPVNGEDGVLAFDIPEAFFADLGSVRWSPQAVDADGERIALHWNGSVYSVLPNGTGGTTLATGHSPQWSPDAQWLAFTRPTRKGQNWQYQLIRITASGSDPLTLTSDLPAGSPKATFAWAP